MSFVSSSWTVCHAFEASFKVKFVQSRLDAFEFQIECDQSINSPCHSWVYQYALRPLAQVSRSASDSATCSTKVAAYVTSTFSVIIKLCLTKPATQDTFVCSIQLVIITNDTGKESASYCEVRRGQMWLAYPSLFEHVIFFVCVWILSICSHVWNFDISCT